MLGFCKIAGEANSSLRSSVLLYTEGVNSPYATWRNKCYARDVTPNVSLIRGYECFVYFKAAFSSFVPIYQLCLQQYREEIRLGPNLFAILW